MSNEEPPPLSKGFLGVGERTTDGDGQTRVYEAGGLFVRKFSILSFLRKPAAASISKLSLFQSMHNATLASIVGFKIKKFSITLAR
jgi:hypothetical protein